MISHFNEQKIFLLDGYLEMYPTPMTIENGQYGYVIVDSSRSCFPLVIYPKSHTKLNLNPNKSRISGLKKAIRDLNTSRSKILATMENNISNNWEKLEPTLEKIFNYPNKPANDECFTSILKIA